ncbi:hypothetical protein ACXN5S_17940 [Pseudoroseicyclus sp. H15]
MLDDIHPDTPSRAALDRFAAMVRDDLLAKTERLRVLARSDGDDPEDWANWDKASMVAAQMIARDGLGARATPANLASLGMPGDDREFGAQVDQLLDSFVGQARSEGWQNRTVSQFTGLTGEAVTTALARMAVFEAYHHGRSIAWQAANRLPEARTTAHAEAADAAVVRHLNSLPSRIDHPVASPAPQSAPTIVPVVADQEVEEQPYDPSIMAVAERLATMGERAGHRQDTLTGYLRSASLFTRLTGVADIRRVGQKDLARFGDLLHRVPKSLGKRSSDADLDLRDVLELAGTMPKSRVGLATGTIKRHFGVISQLLDRARLDGIPVDRDLNVTGLKPKPTRQEKRRREKRSTFTSDEVY